jgi:hypothetical protein
MALKPPTDGNVLKADHRWLGGSVAIAVGTLAAHLAVVIGPPHCQREDVIRRLKASPFPSPARPSKPDVCFPPVPEVRVECDDGERFKARVNTLMRHKPLEKDEKQVPIN